MVKVPGAALFIPATRLFLLYRKRGGSLPRVHLAEAPFGKGYDTALSLALLGGVHERR